MKYLWSVLIMMSSSLYAFEQCGQYKLEGVLRKQAHVWNFIYREHASSEVRFKILSSDIQLSKNFQGLYVSALIQIKKTCRYDCSAELKAAYPLNPDLLPKPLLESPAPLLLEECIAQK